MKLHRHKWVNDSLGAVYCLGCRQFKEWKSAHARRVTRPDGGRGIEAWGYLINGAEWLADKEWEITLAGGLYPA